MPKSRHSAAEPASSKQAEEPSQANGETKQPSDSETPLERIHKVLEQFLDVLSSHDEQNLLSSMQDNHPENPVTIETLRSKLKNYKTIEEFKHDLESLFRNALTSSNHRETLEKLYLFSIWTLQLEAKRLTNENIEYDDLEEHVALFRPSLDGFIFTDALPRSQITKEEKNLPLGVEELVVHPAPPVKDVPNLKNTVSPPPRFPPKLHRHEDKPVVPIQWLDYGPFSSFAPTRDSNNANVSYENTYIGRAARRYRKWEKKQRKTQASSRSPPSTKVNGEAAQSAKEEEIDVAWLKEQGLDADAIVQAAESESLRLDELFDPDDIDGLLERNSELLLYLMQYQEYRFSIGDAARWGAVDEAEQQIAKSLQTHMQHLISKVPPKDLVDVATIEKAMRRVPVTHETTFRGSLPPNKIFAYHTREPVEPLPPTANLLPSYPKERWRWVDNNNDKRPTPFLPATMPVPWPYFPPPPPPPPNNSSSTR